MATSSQIERHAAATLKRLNSLPKPELSGKPIVRTYVESDISSPIIRRGYADKGYTPPYPSE